MLIGYMITLFRVGLCVNIMKATNIDYWFPTTLVVHEEQSVWCVYVCLSSCPCIQNAIRIMIHYDFIAIIKIATLDFEPNDRCHGPNDHLLTLLKPYSDFRISGWKIFLFWQWMHVACCDKTYFACLSSSPCDFEWGLSGCFSAKGAVIIQQNQLFAALP